jgi:nucleotide-binding universal stress UspA family protein
MTGSLATPAPYPHVVVATDGSALAGTALIGGSILAARTSAELHVFHASSDPHIERMAVSQAADLLRGRPYKMEVRDLVEGPGSPSTLIAEYATQLGDESIVAVGTHGRGGIGVSVLGSTAVDLLARRNQTTLAYGPAARPPLDIERVVVCVDGSEFSEASVPEGARWAAALDVPIWVIQVVPAYVSSYVRTFENSYVRNVAKNLEGLPRGVEWDVLHSTSPARSILDLYGNDGANMLIMATHGLVGLRRVLVGSISSDVVKDAWGPVVMVRPAD